MSQQPPAVTSPTRSVVMVLLVFTLCVLAVLDTVGVGEAPTWYLALAVPLTVEWTAEWIRYWKKQGAI